MNFTKVYVSRNIFILVYPRQIFLGWGHGQPSIKYKNRERKRKNEAQKYSFQIFFYLLEKMEEKGG